jgi:hypothetical protein
MTLLRSAGFDLYDSNLLTSRMGSPLLSPVLTDDSSSVLELGSDITTESGAVLTRTRSSTESSLVSSLQLSRAKAEMTSGDVPPIETGQPIPTSHTRSKSHSPTSGEVDVLAPDLACVGLSDEHVENWGLKIVKLVAFPELIPSTKMSLHSITDQTRFYSRNAAARPYDDSESPFFEPFSTVSTPPTRGRRQTTSSSSSSSSSSGEDGYFSHSPTSNDLSSSPVSSAASRSYPDVTKSLNSMGPSFKPVTKRLITPLSPIDPTPNTRRPKLTEVDTAGGPISSRPASVNFFSFTRTSEGSSLTTDVSLLAALFPPNERHMVICSGELDAVDSSDTEVIAAEDDEHSSGILKCLQIDLRRFGLGEPRLTFDSL